MRSCEAPHAQRDPVATNRDRPDVRRYVGALIGIHNPAGEKVGTVSHTRNQEYVVIAGDPATVRRMTTTFAAAIAS